jgi:hypothetical protein
MGMTYTSGTRKLIYATAMDKERGYRSGYNDWLDDRGVRVRVPLGSRILSSTRRPNRL